MSDANPVGRPTLYDPRFCSIATNLGLLGLTNAEVAEALGIHVDTLYEWRKQHAEFSDALSAGKVEADGKVARALYDAAMSGNVTACIFWLKNRKRAQWRDQVPEPAGDHDELVKALQASAKAAEADEPADVAAVQAA
jgi:hypothetical protein